MNYAQLRKHLIALASLPETDSPFVSAFLNLDQPLAQLRNDLRNWTELTRHTFSGQTQIDFDDAVEEIASWLNGATGKSSAVFCRWGEHPMLLPMSFDVPMETRLHVERFPVIYPLVELKDRFNRFVVVLTTSVSAKIIEVNLGSHSVDLLTKRPDLRRRIGREWTREHYANHRKERDRQFLKEKISVIEGLMAKRGHNSLIVAGDPQCVARLTEALPKPLKAKLVGEIRSGIANRNLQDVVSEAVGAFLDAEREQSLGTVQKLIEAVRSRGLASVGYEATRGALLQGRVSQLVVSSQLLHQEREELVRLASQFDIPIETVTDCDLLDCNGGVGALLRYDLPDPNLRERTSAA